MNKLSYVTARKEKQCDLNRQKKERATYVARSFFIALLCLVFFPVGVSAAERSIEKRMQKLERLLDNQSLIQMSQALQALQREVSELRGDVEVMTFELDKLKKQQKDIYLDLDQRIQQVEQSVTASRSSAPTSGFGSASGADADTQAMADEDVQETLGEQESYQASLTLLKNGRYEDAIESYQMFIINYPESTYAPNAQYWMAEAYYVLKNFQSAISHFQKVISAYPNSRKVSDAYLKIGFAYYELKDWVNARNSLEKVVTDYSASTAARLAQRRIQKMKLEGKI